MASRDEPQPKRGTKITYRGGPKNPKKDNRKSMNDIASLPGLSPSEQDFRKMMRDPAMAFFHITEEDHIGICKLWYKRFPFLLLEPNPVTFYYSTAFDTSNQLDDARAQLNTLLAEDIDSHVKRQRLAVAYSYVFKVTTVCISFAYLALEAFLNQQLPLYSSITYKGKEHSKEKVERYFSFDEKLDAVIPQLAGKDFAAAYPKKRDQIRKLKELRHDITHLKQKQGSGITHYEAFYQEILNANLKSIVVAVKACINFYYPGLIVNFKAQPVKDKHAGGK